MAYLFLLFTSFAWGNEYVSLCYHDITSSLTGNRYTIGEKTLIEQFEYLKANGYQSIGIDDILEARAGKKKLPPKSVLITVDDGLESFYDTFYPLLKAYKFKAVFAVVNRWTNQGYALNYEPFGNKRAKMASWARLKEMANSGLVEIASHSFDLHQGVVFNPQANEAPAAGYFRYDPVKARYESDKEFEDRIDSDLKKSAASIKARIGRAPRVMVWPYGSFNTLSRKAAEKNGMALQFTIEEGPNNPKANLVRRNMVMAGTKLETFAWMLKRNLSPDPTLRSVRVDTNALAKGGTKAREIALGKLIERLRLIGVNTAFVEAGNFFPPEGEDFFGRIAHQLLTRTKVEHLYGVLHVGKGKYPDLWRKRAAQIARNSHFQGILLEGEGADLVFEAVKEGLLSYRPLGKVIRSVESESDLPSALARYDLVVLKNMPKGKSSTRALVELPLDSSLKKNVDNALVLGWPSIGYSGEPAKNSTASLRSIFSSSNDPFEYLDRSLP